MNTDTINGRLAVALETRQITLKQVHNDTGIKYNTLQKALSGTSQKIDSDNFAKIWQAYPQLDGWHILTGQPSFNPCTDVEEKLQQVRAIVL